MISKLIDIVGSENISNDPEVLQTYSRDLYSSLLSPKGKPDCVIMPKEIEELTQIMKFANKNKVPVIPRSSGLDLHGDSIPIFGGLMIDLSTMNRIIDICPTALEGVFSRVEPGVTFFQLYKELKKVNMRALLPARLSASTTPASTYFNRNVLFSSAKHGYTGDWVILSHEIILPTGEILRTGNLTLPNSGGTMPHSHGSDLGRILMGSLGTTGIVTKVTIKIKDEPEERKIFFLTSENLAELLKAVKSILRYSPIEIGEEHITMNKLCLASLLASNSKDFDNLNNMLPTWVHILALTGKKDWVDCQEKDLMDAAQPTALKPTAELEGIEKAPEEFSDEFSNPMRIERTFQYLPYNHIEFYTAPSKIHEFEEGIRTITSKTGYSKDLGICIVPIEQSRTYYVEYDLYFDPSNTEEMNQVKETYKLAYTYLINNGALINTPHDYFVAEQLYSKMQVYYETMLKIKKLIDPNDIMHPGKLFL